MVVNLLKADTVKVSLVRAERCADCPGTIEYVYVENNWGPEGGLIRLTAEESSASAHPRKSWLHVGGGLRCASPYKTFGSAYPRTRCRKCQKRATLVTRQEPWGDRTRCRNPRCDYTDFQSIGD